jgi:hypothetical protein
MMMMMMIISPFGQCGCGRPLRGLVVDQITTGVDGPIMEVLRDRYGRNLRPCFSKSNLGPGQFSPVSFVEAAPEVPIVSIPQYLARRYKS